MMTSTMQIELEPLSPCGTQPSFLAPLVHAIWPRRGAEIVALFSEGSADVNASKDHPFAIKLAGHYVGITGYYSYGPTSLGLCWHGVLPEVRGRGVSRAAFEQVLVLAAQRYPDATEIVELIPSDRDADLVPYFTKLGFTHDGEIATFGYLPKGPLWRVFRAQVPTSPKQQTH